MKKFPGPTKWMWHSKVAAREPTYIFSISSILASVVAHIDHLHCWIRTYAQWRFLPAWLARSCSQAGSTTSSQNDNPIPALTQSQYLWSTKCTGYHSHAQKSHQISRFVSIKQTCRLHAQNQAHQLFIRFLLQQKPSFAQKPTSPRNWRTSVFHRFSEKGTKANRNVRQIYLSAPQWTCWAKSNNTILESLTVDHNVGKANCTGLDGIASFPS